MSRSSASLAATEAFLLSSSTARAASRVLPMALVDEAPAFSWKRLAASAALRAARRIPSARACEILPASALPFSAAASAASTAFLPALAASCDGATVTTIEGLAQDGQLHPMQEAFRQHHGLQCGYCTPGMIMAAVDIVNRKGSTVSEAVIREELDGNICRCTGYHNIVAAVRAGAAAMAGASRRQAAE